jgi:hypothetical protein
MYKLYYELDAPEVLNLTRIEYSRYMDTIQCNHGSSSWREPAGYRWSDLELEGVCDELSAVFFSRIINTFVGILPTFYIRKDEENYYLRVTQGSIIKWNYADSEYGPSENFSLTLSVGNIQRIMFGSKDDLKKEKPKNKPKQKKVIIPERQIVICRTI